MKFIMPNSKPCSRGMSKFVEIRDPAKCRECENFEKKFLCLPIGRRRNKCAKVHPCPTSFRQDFNCFQDQQKKRIIIFRFSFNLHVSSLSLYGFAQPSLHHPNCFFLFGNKVAHHGVGAFVARFAGFIQDLTFYF